MEPADLLAELNIFSVIGFSSPKAADGESAGPSVRNPIGDSFLTTKNVAQFVASSVMFVFPIASVFARSVRQNSRMTRRTVCFLAYHRESKDQRNRSLWGVRRQSAINRISRRPVGSSRPLLRSFLDRARTSFAYKFADEKRLLPLRSHRARDPLYTVNFIRYYKPVQSLFSGQSFRIFSATNIFTKWGRLLKTETRVD